MSLGPAQAAALTRLAHDLGRDLQRAARILGGPAGLWRAGGAELAAALRLEGDRARELGVMRAAIDPVRSLGEVTQRGLRLAALGGPGYPERLAGIYDPPFALIGEGWTVELDDALRERPTIAIVGSRRAGTAARAFARGLAAGLAERGAVIVSGLARGVDAEAHQGALDVDGVTVAVLGCGTDCGYPRANRALRQRIIRSGAVLTEYWPATEPAPWRFPARNRIVSGLAHAVVVVEAATRSGALITADFALEHGRPVLAVPGPPWAEGSGGCNELIRMGAGVCTAVDDVVAEVPHPGWRAASAARPSVAGLEGTSRVVYDALRSAPQRVDELTRGVGGDPAGVAAALAYLEVEGLVIRGEGQRWWAAPGVG